MLQRPPPPAHIHLACLHRRARHCRRTAPFRRANRDIECRLCGVAATAPASHAPPTIGPCSSGGACRGRHVAGRRHSGAGTARVWIDVPHPAPRQCTPQTRTHPVAIAATSHPELLSSLGSLLLHAWPVFCSPGRSGRGRAHAGDGACCRHPDAGLRPYWAGMCRSWCVSVIGTTAGVSPCPWRAGEHAARGP